MGDPSHPRVPAPDRPPSPDAGDLLTLRLRVPRSEFRRGEIVPITLTLLNRGTRVYVFNAVQPRDLFDVVIHTPSGVVVGRWSDTIPPNRSLRPPRPLKVCPGDRLVQVLSWAQRVRAGQALRPMAPGRYVLTGLFLVPVPTRIIRPVRPLESPPVTIIVK